MTPDQEKQLLQSMYDRIFQAITYVPDGKAGSFDPNTTLLQFSKNEAINPADFKNQATPMNPNGDLNAAQQFSAMVDIIPAVQPDYNSSAVQLSTTYQQLVNNANTAATINPTQKATYDAAYNFLNTSTSIPNFQGPPTVTNGPSVIAQSYDDNQAAYITAVGGYRTAMNGYDLTNTQDQRSWQAVAPGLQLNIDKAWNQWVRQGKQNVEQAQNAMAATINDIISSIIGNSQTAVGDDKWLAPSVVGGNKWLLSYPLPGDWASGSVGATKFQLRSSYMNTESSSNYNSYGGGGGFGYGLWSVGGSFNHTDGQTNSHMDANTVEINANLTLVKIMRPWLNPLLFRTQGWWEKGQSINKISNGKLIGNSAGMLPLIPTAFVVMSDVTIKADFSASDKSHIESATSGSSTVGWGPFSVSGSYSHSNSQDKFTSTFDSGTLRIPGMQVVAWVSAITPASAPVDGTGK